MIVQRVAGFGGGSAQQSGVTPRGDSGLLVVRQTDHALLSGAFAAAWTLAPIPQAASTLVAASRHDDGWSEWELAPRVGPSGMPIDFIRVPVPEHTALYRRGIDLVEAEDPWAGCVVSLHGKRLYTRSLVPGAEPRYKLLKGHDLDVAERYIFHEVTRERRLVRALCADGAYDVEEVRAGTDEAWRLLQVWDRLSLFVCLFRLGGGGSMTMPAVKGPSGEDVALSLSTTVPDGIELDPWPFAGAEAWFEIEVSDVEGDRWDDDAAFRRAFRTSPRRILRFVARGMTVAKQRQGGMT